MINFTEIRMTGMNNWTNIGRWVRVVCIRGWARGRQGWLCRDGAYSVIKFSENEETDCTNFYYNESDVRESDDELSDFVILTRTEKRSP